MMQVLESVRPTLDDAVAKGISVQVFDTSSHPLAAGLPIKDQAEAAATADISWHGHQQTDSLSSKRTYAPFLASALLVFAAAVGTTAGYVAGGAFSCNLNPMPDTVPQWSAMEASYNESVLAVSNGTWPEGQVCTHC